MIPNEILVTFSTAQLEEMQNPQSFLRRQIPEQLPSIYMPPGEYRYIAGTFLRILPGIPKKEGNGKIS